MHVFCVVHIDRDRAKIPAFVDQYTRLGFAGRNIHMLMITDAKPVDPSAYKLATKRAGLSRGQLIWGTQTDADIAEKLTKMQDKRLSFGDWALWTDFNGTAPYQADLATVTVTLIRQGHDYLHCANTNRVLMHRVTLVPTADWTGIDIKHAQTRAEQTARDRAYDLTAPKHSRAEHLARIAAGTVTGGTLTDITTGCPAHAAPDDTTTVLTAQAAKTTTLQTQTRTPSRPRPSPTPAGTCTN